MPEPPDIVLDSLSRRAVDLILSVPAAIVLAPLMLLLALLVRLESTGPALYVQQRMGRGEGMFPILKFRTMVVGADTQGPGVSGDRDPRITRLGRFLRATKLDELPQLLNIVRGEMTLIGPRAEVPRYLPHYTADERLLLSVRPGLTGPGQVYFTVHQAGELDRVADPERHYIEQQLHAKLAIDLDYLRHRGVRRDLGILARTVALLAGARV